MKQNFRVLLLLLPAFFIWKLPVHLLYAPLGETESRTLYAIFKNILVVCYTLWLIKKEGIGNTVLGFSRLRHGWLTLIPLFFVAWHAVRNWSDWSDPGYHGLLFYLMAMKCVSIGFSEEFLFRAFLQNYFLERRTKSTEILFPILKAALFFGLLHGVNFMDLDIFSLINQMIVAVAIGFAFGAFYFRTRNIYPLVLLHAVIDFSAGFKGYIKNSASADAPNPTLMESLTSTLVMCILAALIFFVGWLLLRYRRSEDAVLPQSNAATEPVALLQVPAQE